MSWFIRCAVTLVLKFILSPRTFKEQVASHGQELTLSYCVLTYEMLHKDRKLQINKICIMHYHIVSWFNRCSITLVLEAILSPKLSNNKLRPMGKNWYYLTVTWFMECSISIALKERLRSKTSKQQVTPHGQELKLSSIRIDEENYLLFVHQFNLANTLQ